jgi:hypothetical protein
MEIKEIKKIYERLTKSNEVGSIHGIISSGDLSKISEVGSIHGIISPEDLSKINERYVNTCELLGLENLLGQEPKIPVEQKCIEFYGKRINDPHFRWIGQLVSRGIKLHEELGNENDVIYLEGLKKKLKEMMLSSVESDFTIVGVDGLYAPVDLEITEDQVIFNGTILAATSGNVKLNPYEKKGKLVGFMGLPIAQPLWFDVMDGELVVLAPKVSHNSVDYVGKPYGTMIV